jgi:hypothetical protein
MTFKLRGENSDGTTNIPSLAKRGRCYVGLAKSGILR